MNLQTLPTQETINQNMAYYLPLSHGNEQTAKAKTLLNLLQDGYQLNGLAELVGYEVPDGYRVREKFGVWTIVPDGVF